MKKFLKIFIPLLILGALAYQFRAPLHVEFSTIENKLFAQAPCSKPIPYNLGTFDTQFGISKDYFLSALADAEAVWEKAAGKQLFIYSPTDFDSTVLKINLVYDYRQEATTTLASLGITVNNTKGSYDSLKAKLDTEKSDYTTEKAAFDTQVTSFDQEQNNYNTEVNSWNAKGGAPQDMYDKLQSEKSSLSTEAKNLQNTQDMINTNVDEINALVVAVNNLADTLNLSVEKYNSVNGSLGESFEEGVYVEDGGTRYIDIYEYSDRDKLVRVLAHELGHALGLQHVDDPKAIMYKFNQGNNLTPTNADLDELNTVCGAK